MQSQSQSQSTGSRSSARTRNPVKPFGNVLHIEDARASDDDMIDDIDEGEDSDPFDEDFRGGYGLGKRERVSDDDEEEEGEDDKAMKVSYLWRSVIARGCSADENQPKVKKRRSKPGPKSKSKSAAKEEEGGSSRSKSTTSKSKSKKTNPPLQLTARKTGSGLTSITTQSKIGPIGKRTGKEKVAITPIIKQGATRKKLDLLVQPKATAKVQPKTESEEEQEEGKEGKQGNGGDGGNIDVSYGAPEEKDNQLI